MDTGEIYRVGSLHRDSTGSSAWRRGDVVFSNSRSRSSEHGEDDEEALRRAALEKLPTFARLQHAVLPPSDDVSDGGAAARNVVDVRGLGPHEDNERFLRKLKDRIDR